MPGTDATTGADLARRGERQSPQQHQQNVQSPPPERPPNQAAPGGGPPQAEEPPPLLEQVLRMLLVFFALQFVMQQFLPSRLQPPTPDGPATEAERQQQRTKPLGATPSSGRRPICLWSPGTVMDLDVFVTDSPDYALEGGKQKRAARKALLAEWHEAGLVLGSVGAVGLSSSPKSHRNATIAVPFTDAVRSNETHLYAHVRLSRQRSGGGGGDVEGKKEGDGGKDPDVLTKTVQLTRHRLRKKLRDEKSLLGGSEDGPDAAKTEPAAIDPDDSSPLTAASLDRTHDQILLYMKPSLTLQIVDVAMQFPERRSIPPQFADHMDWYDETEYYPILYSSEFWITKDSLIEVNGTVRESELEITFEASKMWKWQIMSQMEQTWRTQESLTGEEDSTNDMFRTMLLETNPYLLGVTAIVSLLHTIFDILAFKNDISFFKGKKSMEGLSLRSMLVNTWFQVVILLYLADNETSFMILMSNGVGLAIEVWKITKAVKISFRDGKLEWEEASSYKKSRTKEYDEIATSHLLFVTMPLVAGYGVYSLMYQKHKGWYSWILNTLVGFIYMFGFVMMTPQLFINYKLQSVAHLNWRTMTYKSINTFIDDLFAFVIKMPIMHRLACLRDDVVFLIFCYQRYKYRTDYTRVNEYGQCIQPTEEMLKETEEEEAQSRMVEQRSKVPGSESIRRRRGARDKRVASS